MIEILPDTHDLKTMSYVLVETEYIVLLEALIYGAEAITYTTLYCVHE